MATQQQKEVFQEMLRSIKETISFLEKNEGITKEIGQGIFSWILKAYFEFEKNGTQLEQPNSDNDTETFLSLLAGCGDVWAKIKTSPIVKSVYLLIYELEQAKIEQAKSECKEKSLNEAVVLKCLVRAFFICEGLVSFSEIVKNLDLKLIGYVFGNSSLYKNLYDNIKIQQEKQEIQEKKDSSKEKKDPSKENKDVDKETERKINEKVKNFLGCFNSCSTSVIDVLLKDEIFSKQTPSQNLSSSLNSNLNMSSNLKKVPDEINNKPKQNNPINNDSIQENKKLKEMNSRHALLGSILNLLDSTYIQLANNEKNKNLDKPEEYAYRLMFNAIGESPKKGEIVFDKINNGTIIVGKMYGRDNFNIPEQNPIYSIIKNADRETKFTSEEKQKLLENTLTLLRGYTKQELMKQLKQYTKSMSNFVKDAYKSQFYYNSNNNLKELADDLWAKSLFLMNNLLDLENKEKLLNELFQDKDSSFLEIFKNFFMGGLGEAKLGPLYKNNDDEKRKKIVISFQKAISNHIKDILQTNASVGKSDILSAYGMIASMVKYGDRNEVTQLIVDLLNHGESCKKLLPSLDNNHSLRNQPKKNLFVICVVNELPFEIISNILDKVDGELKQKINQIILTDERYEIDEDKESISNDNFRILRLKVIVNTLIEGEGKGLSEKMLLMSDIGLLCKHSNLSQTKDLLIELAKNPHGIQIIKEILGYESGFNFIHHLFENENLLEAVLENMQDSDRALFAYTLLTKYDMTAASKEVRERLATTFAKNINVFDCKKSKLLFDKENKTFITLLVRSLGFIDLSALIDKYLVKQNSILEIKPHQKGLKELKELKELNSIFKKFFETDAVEDAMLKVSNMLYSIIIDNESYKEMPPETVEVLIKNLTSEKAILLLTQNENFSKWIFNKQNYFHIIASWMSRIDVKNKQGIDKSSVCCDIILGIFEFKSNVQKSLPPEEQLKTINSLIGYLNEKDLVKLLNELNDVQFEYLASDYLSKLLKKYSIDKSKECYDLILRIFKFNSNDQKSLPPEKQLKKIKPLLVNLNTEDLRVLLEGLNDAQFECLTSDYLSKLLEKSSVDKSKECYNFILRIFKFNSNDQKSLPPEKQLKNIDSLLENLNKEDLSALLQGLNDVQFEYLASDCLSKLLEKFSVRISVEIETKIFNILMKHLEKNNLDKMKGEVITFFLENISDDQLLEFLSSLFADKNWVSTLISLVLKKEDGSAKSAILLACLKCTPATATTMLTIFANHEDDDKKKIEKTVNFISTVFNTGFAGGKPSVSYNPETVIVLLLQLFITDPGAFFKLDKEIQTAVVKFLYEKKMLLNFVDERLKQTKTSDNYSVFFLFVITVVAANAEPDFELLKKLLDALTSKERESLFNDPKYKGVVGNLLDEATKNLEAKADDSNKNVKGVDDFFAFIFKHIYINERSNLYREKMELSKDKNDNIYCEIENKPPFFIPKGEEVYTIANQYLENNNSKLLAEEKENILKFILLSGYPHSNNKNISGWSFKILSEYFDKLTSEQFLYLFSDLGKSEVESLLKSNEFISKVLSKITFSSLMNFLKNAFINEQQLLFNNFFEILCKRGELSEKIEIDDSVLMSINLGDNWFDNNLIKKLFDNENLINYLALQRGAFFEKVLKNIGDSKDKKIDKAGEYIFQRLFELLPKLNRSESSNQQPTQQPTVKAIINYIDKYINLQLVVPNLLEILNNKNLAEYLIFNHHEFVESCEKAISNNKNDNNKLQQDVYQLFFENLIKCNPEKHETIIDFLTSKIALSSILITKENSEKFCNNKNLINYLSSKYSTNNRWLNNLEFMKKLIGDLPQDRKYEVCLQLFQLKEINKEIWMFLFKEGNLGSASNLVDTENQQNVQNKDQAQQKISARDVANIITAYDKISEGKNNEELNNDDGFKDFIGRQNYTLENLLSIIHGIKEIGPKPEAAKENPENSLMLKLTKIKTHFQTVISERFPIFSTHAENRAQNNNLWIKIIEGLKDDADIASNNSKPNQPPCNENSQLKNKSINSLTFADVGDHIDLIIKQNKTALIVDADIQRSWVSKLLKRENEQGFEELKKLDASFIKSCFSKKSTFTLEERELLNKFAMWCFEGNNYSNGIESHSEIYEKVFEDYFFGSDEKENRYEKFTNAMLSATNDKQAENLADFWHKYLATQDSKNALEKVKVILNRAKNESVILIQSRTMEQIKKDIFIAEDEIKKIGESLKKATGTKIDYKRIKANTAKLDLEHSKQYNRKHKGSLFYDVVYMIKNIFQKVGGGIKEIAKSAQTKNARIKEEREKFIAALKDNFNKNPTGDSRERYQNMVTEWLKKNDLKPEDIIKLTDKNLETKSEVCKFITEIFLKSTSNEKITAFTKLLGDRSANDKAKVLLESLIKEETSTRNLIDDDNWRRNVNNIYKEDVVVNWGTMILDNKNPSLQYLYNDSTRDLCINAKSFKKKANDVSSTDEEYMRKILKDNKFTSADIKKLEYYNQEPAFGISNTFSATVLMECSGKNIKFNDSEGNSISCPFHLAPEHTEKNIFKVHEDIFFNCNINYSVTVSVGDSKVVNFPSEVNASSKYLLTEQGLKLLSYTTNSQVVYDLLVGGESNKKNAIKKIEETIKEIASNPNFAKIFCSQWRYSGNKGMEKVKTNWQDYFSVSKYRDLIAKNFKSIFHGIKQEDHEAATGFVEMCFEIIEKEARKNNKEAPSIKENAAEGERVETINSYLTGKSVSSNEQIMKTLLNNSQGNNKQLESNKTGENKNPTFLNLSSIDNKNSENKPKDPELNVLDVTLKQN